jgi:hypothetical protein
MASELGHAVPKRQAGDCVPFLQERTTGDSRRNIAQRILSFPNDQSVIQPLMRFTALPMGVCVVCSASYEECLWGKFPYDSREMIGLIHLNAHRGDADKIETADLQSLGEPFLPFDVNI